MSKRARGVTQKSARRTVLVDGVMSALKSDYIFQTLDYRRRSENYLKQYMHRPLLKAVERLHSTLSPSLSRSTIEKKAKNSLLWEGDVQTTINNIRFLGAQHRPDFVVQIDGLRIAVEVKRGQAGSAIREGIGQSLVYAASRHFDFVVYLFVDTSKDKKVQRSMQEDRDSAFVESLWNNYNVRFEIV